MVVSTSRCHCPLTYRHYHLIRDSRKHLMPQSETSTSICHSKSFKPIVLLLLCLFFAAKDYYRGAQHAKVDPKKTTAKMLLGQSGYVITESATHALKALGATEKAISSGVTIIRTLDDLNLFTRHGCRE